MSDIKASTLLSRWCDHIAALLYALILNKYRNRLSDTKEGSGERLVAAQDITRNLGFFEQAGCRLASGFISLSFFFMKDIDEAQARAMLEEKDDDEENAS